MAFQLNIVSLERMRFVHCDLQAVVRLAALYSEVEFIVTEGARTKARQAELVKAGASRTMNSRHLPDDRGIAYAVDIAAYVDGQVRWDWPLYHKINRAFQRAAAAFQVPIIWGGNWESFPDGPHYELPRNKYPPVVHDPAKMVTEA